MNQNIPQSGPNEKMRGKIAVKKKQASINFLMPKYKENNMKMNKMSK